MALGIVQVSDLKMGFEKRGCIGSIINECSILILGVYADYTATQLLLLSYDRVHFYITDYYQTAVSYPVLSIRYINGFDKQIKITTSNQGHFLYYDISSER